jgi:hypothetical protein
MIGSSQWREATLAAGTLTLSADEHTVHGVRRHAIEWRRPVSPA